MKLTMKKPLMAAAIAAMAMSGAANAAIDSNSGNSELVFSAWNLNAGVGYTLDLNTGLFLNDFVGIDQAATAAGNTALLAGAKVANAMVGAGGVIFDQALTGFNLGGALASGVEWNLGAFDQTGRTRMMITQGDSNLPFASTNNQVKAAVTGFDGYTSFNNGLIVTAATDTFATSIAADGAGFAGNMGNGFVGNLADTTNVLGGTSNLYFLAPTTQASSALASLNQQLFTVGGQAVFARTYLSALDSQYHLQIAAAVAAVPEADTYAMFLAGLGLMGFIARRRMQA